MTSYTLVSLCLLGALIAYLYHVYEKTKAFCEEVNQFEVHVNKELQRLEKISTKKMNGKEYMAHYNERTLWWNHRLEIEISDPMDAFILIFGGKEPARLYTERFQKSFLEFVNGKN